MKIPTIVFLLILVFTPVLTFADVSYRAGYEVTLQVGDENSSIQTRSGISPSRPIVHQMGRYEVTISMSDVSSTTYSISIVVTEDVGATLKSERIRHTSEGRYNGILEFANKNDVISLEGAIAIGKIGS